MEADILKSLKFELGNPTIKTFLRRFTRVAQEDYKVSKFLILFLFLQICLRCEFDLLPVSIFYASLRLLICN